eukprot:TRINITY_DN8554_c0_g1_i1.p1 TRINITY_DN8554_c0_g1~~TRINITY_DN8554_c0_g1_i1.p1  ORF type:complete len:189 (-),score=30.90 TRINITY_DN8554_c0_g1_i1:24-590(-)
MRGAIFRVPSSPVTNVMQKRYYEKIAPKDAIKAYSDKRGVFIDVRTSDNFGKLSTNFRHIPWSTFAGKIPQDLDRFDTYYIIDTFGYHSEKVAKILEANKFDVKVIEGGVLEWAFNGGELSSSIPSVKAQLAEALSLSPTKLSSAHYIESAHDLGIKPENIVYPEGHLFFNNKEEEEKVLKPKREARK